VLLTWLKRDWEDLGRVDPLWAVLTDPGRRFRKWDRAEFLASGAAEVARVMQTAQELELPRQRGAALDFGCGVGRVTRPLADHFRCCVGVDISEAMISQAREWHRDAPRCRFVVNTRGDLRLFDDRSFDLVYSNVVLQHLPSSRLMASYITECIRILADGGLLIFQLPRHIPWKNRIQPRRRAYHLLRALGASEAYLLNSLKLTPMCMNFLPEAKVRDLVQAAGGAILSIERMSDIYQIYYVTRSSPTSPTR
jgi:ubiquinone/menaquinone biosynthesis C-methylase UbiE